MGDTSTAKTAGYTFLAGMIIFGGLFTALFAGLEGAFISGGGIDYFIVIRALPNGMLVGLVCTFFLLMFVGCQES
ncbi:MAG: hypothetical protein ACFFF4_10205 [Candidatus Thorarchaeota archaeon]